MKENTKQIGQRTVVRGTGAATSRRFRLSEGGEGGYKDYPGLSNRSIIYPNSSVGHTFRKRHGDEVKRLKIDVVAGENSLEALAVGNENKVFGNCKDHKVFATLPKNKTAFASGER